MKKFLAAVLATALIFTGLYPVQFLKAAPTTTQNDGLNFANSSPWLYSGIEGYYLGSSSTNCENTSIL